MFFCRGVGEGHPFFVVFLRLDALIDKIFRFGIQSARYVPIWMPKTSHFEHFGIQIGSQQYNWMQDFYSSKENSIHNGG